MTYWDRGTVLYGEDRLRDYIAGKRVAIMTNSSAITNRGGCLIDDMHGIRNTDIAFALGMEHGVRGEQFAGVKVESRPDAKTGIMVHSLYEYPGLKPPVELLSQVDAVVFTAQDVGIRHWTYTPWMIFLIEMAAKAGCEVIILDRPNPLGGIVVEGAGVEPEFFSILGGFDYPLRHGMTIGELAEMYNSEYNIGCKLRVINMEGYARDQLFSDTGLLWTPPSPNTPNLTALFGFATLGLLQASNVNIGVGTTSPFQLIGAPWMNGQDFAEKLNALNIPGLYAIGKYYVPKHSMHEGKLCDGVYLTYYDEESYRPVTAQLKIITLLRKLYRDTFKLDAATNLCDTRIGSAKLREAVFADIPAERICEEWEANARAFMKKRERYLRY